MSGYYILRDYPITDCEVADREELFHLFGTNFMPTKHGDWVRFILGTIPGITEEGASAKAQAIAGQGGDQWDMFRLRYDRASNEELLRLIAEWPEKFQEAFDKGFIRITSVTEPKGYGGDLLR